MSDDESETLINDLTNFDNLTDAKEYIYDLLKIKKKKTIKQCIKDNKLDIAIFLIKLGNYEDTKCFKHLIQSKYPINNFADLFRLFTTKNNINNCINILSFLMKKYNFLYNIEIYKYVYFLCNHFILNIKLLNNNNLNILFKFIDILLSNLHELITTNKNNYSYSYNLYLQECKYNIILFNNILSIQSYKNKYINLYNLYLAYTNIFENVVYTSESLFFCSTKKQLKYILNKYPDCINELYLNKNALYYVKNIEIFKYLKTKYNMQITPEIIQHYTHMIKINFLNELYEEILLYLNEPIELIKLNKLKIINTISINDTLNIINLLIPITLYNNFDYANIKMYFEFVINTDHHFKYNQNYNEKLLQLCLNLHEKNIEFCYSILLILNISVNKLIELLNAKPSLNLINYIETKYTKYRPNLLFFCINLEQTKYIYNLIPNSYVKNTFNQTPLFFCCTKEQIDYYIDKLNIDQDEILEAYNMYNKSSQINKSRNVPDNLNWCLECKNALYKHISAVNLIIKLNIPIQDLTPKQIYQYAEYKKSLETSSDN